MPEQYGILAGNFLDNTLAGLQTVVELLTRFVRGDQQLRDEQSANAPLAQGFQQGTIIATAITRFDAAQSGVTKFSYAVILLEDTAGECRYTLDTSDPSAAGRGHQVPSTGNGFTLTIPGAENVKNFKIIAATGQTAAFTMQGFR